MHIVNLKKPCHETVTSDDLLRSHLILLSDKYQITKSLLYDDDLDESIRLKQLKACKKKARDLLHAFEFGVSHLEDKYEIMGLLRRIIYNIENGTHDENEPIFE